MSSLVLPYLLATAIESTASVYSLIRTTLPSLETHLLVIELQSCFAKKPEPHEWACTAARTGTAPPGWDV